MFWNSITHASLKVSGKSSWAWTALFRRKQNEPHPRANSEAPAAILAPVSTHKSAQQKDNRTATSRNSPRRTKFSSIIVQMGHLFIPVSIMDKESGIK